VVPCKLHLARYGLFVPDRPSTQSWRDRGRRACRRRCSASPATWSNEPARVRHAARRRVGLVVSGRPPIRRILIKGDETDGARLWPPIRN